MNATSFVSVLWKIMETVKLVALTQILSTRIWYVNRSYKKCRLYISMSLWFSIYIAFMSDSPLVSVVKQGLEHNCEDVWHFSWQNQAQMCNLSCMSYASNTHTYCFICWSPYAYQFPYITNYIHRTDLTSIMLSWLCTPNFVKDRFLKGNCSQNNKPMDSSVLDTYNWEPEPVEPPVWPRCLLPGTKVVFHLTGVFQWLQFDPKTSRSRSWDLWVILIGECSEVSWSWNGVSWRVIRNRIFS